MTLRPAARRIYDALVLYKSEHQGNSPTVRELAALTGRGVASVYAQLRALAAAGLITVEYAQARSITVTGARWLPPPATDI